MHFFSFVFVTFGSLRVCESDYRGAITTFCVRKPLKKALALSPMKVSSLCSVVCVDALLCESAIGLVDNALFVEF